MKRNVPKVGSLMYWKDFNGVIHADYCKRIDKENDPNVETMYFIYVSPNGGGQFITESALISPLSPEVVRYKEEIARRKVIEISDYISQNEVRAILFEKLIKRAFTINEANKILDVLTNYD